MVTVNGVIIQAADGSGPLYTRDVFIDAGKGADKVTVDDLTDTNAAYGYPCPSIEVELGPGNDTFNGSNINGKLSCLVESLDEANDLANANDSYVFFGGGFSENDSYGDDSYEVSGMDAGSQAIGLNDQAGNNHLFVRVNPNGGLTTDQTAVIGNNAKLLGAISYRGPDGLASTQNGYWWTDDRTGTSVCIGPSDNQNPT
jgi:hypothetical protein